MADPGGSSTGSISHVDRTVRLNRYAEMVKDLKTVEETAIDVCRYMAAYLILQKVLRNIDRSKEEAKASGEVFGVEVLSDIEGCPELQEKAEQWKEAWPDKILAWFTENPMMYMAIVHLFVARDAKVDKYQVMVDALMTDVGILINFFNTHPDYDSAAEQFVYLMIGGTFTSPFCNTIITGKFLDKPEAKLYLLLMKLGNLLRSEVSLNTLVVLGGTINCAALTGVGTNLDTTSTLTLIQSVLNFFNGMGATLPWMQQTMSRLTSGDGLGSIMQIMSSRPS